MNIEKDLLKKITNKADETLTLLVQHRNNTDARLSGLPAIPEIDQATFLLELDLEEKNRRNSGINQKRT